MELVNDVTYRLPYVMKNKVIYLKSLVKNFKPKVETLPKDIERELQSLGIDMIKGKKPIDLKADNKAGRDFILDHTEEFLTYAVDYSLNDKMSEFLYEKNSE